jgi:hypothetical protein
MAACRPAALAPRRPRQASRRRPRGGSGPGHQRLAARKAARRGGQPSSGLRRGRQLMALQQQQRAGQQHVLQATRSWRQLPKCSLQHSRQALSAAAPRSWLWALGTRPSPRGQWASSGSSSHSCQAPWCTLPAPQHRLGPSRTLGSTTYGACQRRRQSLESASCPPLSLSAQQQCMQHRRCSRWAPACMPPSTWQQLLRQPRRQALSRRSRQAQRWCRPPSWQETRQQQGALEEAAHRQAQKSSRTGSMVQGCLHRQPLPPPSCCPSTCPRLWV